MFTLPSLSYDYRALEPHIDEETMKIHHGKHHQAYIDKLNAALEGHPDLMQKDVNDLVANLNIVPIELREAVKNHGGGHANHSFFWELMAPNVTGEPSGDLADAIEKTFESFDKFKLEFNQAAVTQFGSGWAWLCLDASNKLVILTTANQNSPLSLGIRPVLGLDVWEHAYYLKYQNKRPDYVSAWWNVVNWAKVSENFSA